MPRFVSGPELTAPKTEVSASLIARLSSVLSAIPGPPHQPALGHVLTMVAIASGRVVAHLSPVPPGVAQIDQELSELTPKVADVSALEATALLRGSLTMYPVWSLFASLDKDSPPEVLATIGAELMLAMSLRRTFRRSIARRVTEIVQAAVDEVDRQVELQALKVFSEKLLGDVACLEGTASQNTKSLQLAARIRASFAAQIDPSNIDDRKAPGSARELSPTELSEAAAAIKHEVESGSGAALAIGVAFCCGPTLETVLDFPFAHCAGDDWAARIDAVSGIVQIDLVGLIKLAEGRPGHQVARLLLTIPLPEFLAEFLRKFIASRPAAKSLREAIGLVGLNPRSPIPGMPSAASTHVSAARFIRSRAVAALRAGVERGLAAYSCGDFSKIGKSSHAYLTFSLDEIWSANASRYEALTWGAPAPQPQAPTAHVGSMATPTAEVVRAVDQRFVKLAEDTRPGRRYSWRSLVQHHNHFALLCTHRTAFFMAARAANQFSFSADLFHPSMTVASFIDKGVGPFSGATPLPRPARMVTQIDLWRAHLSSLLKRVKKLKPPGWEQIASTIGDILDGKDVPLFFLISEADETFAVGSQDLQGQHADVGLKGDWRRHFVINALRAEKVPFTFSGLHMRHHIEGLALTSITSGVPMLLALEALASALDRIALELGMHPIHGLTQQLERQHGNAS